MTGTLEQHRFWWDRIQWIAPWSWKTDPYLVGDLCGGEPIDEETFRYLRDRDARP